MTAIKPCYFDIRYLNKSNRTKRCLKDFKDDVHSNQNILVLNYGFSSHPCIFYDGGLSLTVVKY